MSRFLEYLVVTKDDYFYLSIEKEPFILALNNPELSYYFANCFAKQGANTEKHQQIVLDSKNIMWVYKFAKNVYGADVKKLGQAIIDLGGEYDNLAFAKEVKDADVLAHEQAVISSGNLKCIFQFADTVKGANILELGAAIIASGDLYWNYKYAKDIPGADIQEHGKVVIKSGNLEFIYCFAQNVNGVDFKKYGDAILASNNLEYICKFAEMIQKKRFFINSLSFFDKMANLDIIYRLSRLNIMEYEKAIIESGDLYWNYYYAMNVKYANIRAHENVILTSRNPEFCIKFAGDIPEANVEEFIKALSDCADNVNEKILERREKILLI